MHTNPNITNPVIRQILAEELITNRKINREHMQKFPSYNLSIVDDEAGIRNMALALDIALWSRGLIIVSVGQIE